MPNRALTAKETSVIEYYCNPGSETYNNWCKSYLKAGYSECKGWQANAMRVLQKDYIRVSVAEYRAKIGQVWAHDRQIAVDSLNLNLIRAQHKADNGDIQAVGAITAIIRELNAISYLHSNTVLTSDVELEQLSQAEQEDRKRYAAYELRRSLKLASDEPLSAAEGA